MKFAVVDIETTGLFHQGHAITEIAVVHLDQGVPECVFHRLINPGRAIPREISHLTGIHAGTLKDAPPFREILPELLKVLEGRVFVAHNVNFDFQFLKAQIEACGAALNVKRVCSMRYARKLLPNLTSYRLAAICKALNIENSGQHRAKSDAMATANLFGQLMAKDDTKHLEFLLNKRAKETILPAALSRDSIDGLPENPGVYYFFGIGVKPIYIGKARNLRKRVINHFTAAGTTRRKQLFQREIQRISYTETSSEYQALLLEDAEIKKFWPRHNLAQKQRATAFAVVPYADRSDNQRLAILPSLGRKDALAWFNSTHTAREWLQRESDVYGFNPRRAGLYGPELNNEDKSESNAFRRFLNEAATSVQESFVLAEKEVSGKLAIAVVLSGRYCGYGVSTTSDSFSRAEIENLITPAPDSVTAQAVIRRMMSDRQIVKYPI